MSTPQQTFTAARRKQLDRYTELHANTRREIIAALEAAGAEIVRLLANAPTQWQQDYLARLAPQVSAAMERFRTRGTGAWVDGVQAAWQAGAALVEQPLVAAGALNPGQLQRIDDRALLSMQTFLTRKMRDVTQQARGRIDAQLALALTGVQSNSQTIAGINAVLGGASRRRAITITRTELGRAHAAATFLQLRQAAAVVPGLQKQWRRSGKLRSRLEHDAADGQVRDVEEPFVVGGVRLMYPRDPTAPAEHTINCGCTLLPAKTDWTVANAGKRPFELPEIAADPRRRDANQAIADERARAGGPVNVPGIINSEVVQSAARALADLKPRAPAYTGLADPDALIRIERQIAFASTETGYVIGQSGEPLDIIRGTRDQLDLRHLKPVQTQGLLFTHNHPAGGSFSNADVFTALAMEFGEFRAVSGATVYRLFPRGGVGAAVRFDEALQQLRREFRAEYQAIKQLRLQPDAERIMLSEAWMLLVTQRLGLRYEKTPR